MNDPINPHDRDERYVWFRLTGDFDPDEITRATGLVPDRAWLKGAPYRTGRRASARKFSAWKIDSGLGPSAEFDEHLSTLLERLRPAWAELRELSRRHTAFVGVAIYLHWSQGPAVSVSPTLGAAIAELGATLDFDLYALPEDEPVTDNSGMTLLTREQIGAFQEISDQEPDGTADR